MRPLSPSPLPPSPLLPNPHSGSLYPRLSGRCSAARRRRARRHCGVEARHWPAGRQLFWRWRGGELCMRLRARAACRYGLEHAPSPNNLPVISACFLTVCTLSACDRRYAGGRYPCIRARPEGALRLRSQGRRQLGGVLSAALRDVAIGHAVIWRIIQLGSSCASCDPAAIQLRARWKHAATT